MKLKDLEMVLRSERGNIQGAIVYDVTHDVDLQSNCSVEYAIHKYGHLKCTRIGAENNLVVITVEVPER